MSISGSVAFSVALQDSKVVGINTAAEAHKANANLGFAFTDGAAALMGNQLYSETRTFSGTTDSLDLNGVLKDVFAATVAFVRVKAIYIYNLSASHTLVVGASGSNPWATLLNSTGTLTLNSLGAFMAVDPGATGYVVTPSTADLLLMTGTNGEQYQIAILGATT